MSREQGAADVVWEVSAEMIDLDHLARTYMALQAEAQKERCRRSVMIRFVYPPMTVLALVLGAAYLPWPVIGLVLALFVGLVLWNHGAAGRLAKRLREVPAASEAQTFRATPTGAHLRMASASESMSWSRYESARLFGDLIVLTRDKDLHLLLPTGALVSGQEPQAAIDSIEGWIRASREHRW